MNDNFFCFALKWNSSLLMSTSSFSFLLSLHYRNFLHFFFRTNNARVESLSFTEYLRRGLDIAWCLLWARECVCVDMVKMKFLCCCWPPSGVALFCGHNFQINIFHKKLLTWNTFEHKFRATRNNRNRV